MTFRPTRNRFRQYETQAEADAFDEGFAAFRAGEQLPDDAPPACRTGWFDAEREELGL